jgi:hypothetical protein
VRGKEIGSGFENKGLGDGRGRGSGEGRRRRGRGQKGGTHLTNFLMVGMSISPSAPCVTRIPAGAFAFMWIPRTCRAMPLSRSSSRMSRTMNIRSKRERMVVMRSMFSAADFKSS